MTEFTVDITWADRTFDDETKPCFLLLEGTLTLAGDTYMLRATYPEWSPTDDCQEWDLSLKLDGVEQVSWNGEGTYAHRILIETDLLTESLEMYRDAVETAVSEARAAALLAIMHSGPQVSRYQEEDYA